MSYTPPAYTDVGGSLTSGYTPPAFTDVGGDVILSFDLNFSIAVNFNLSGALSSTVYALQGHPLDINFNLTSALSPTIYSLQGHPLDIPVILNFSMTLMSELIPVSRIDCNFS